VQVNGARLGDDVDDATGSTTALRVRAAGDDLELLDRVERDVDGHPLAADLLAEEAVVVVAAVEADVVENPALARKGDRVTVRPWTTLTPGVSVRKSSNFRPRMGVFSTAAWFSVVATAARAVSTLDMPLTVAVSCTADTVMRGLRLIAWPTVSTTSSCTMVVKPASRKVTR
jgi:hypothetical protein